MAATEKLPVIAYQILHVAAADSLIEDLGGLLPVAVEQEGSELVE